MNHKTQGRAYAFKFLYQIVFEGNDDPKSYSEKLEDFDLSSRQLDPEDISLNPQGVMFGKDLIKKVLPHLEEFRKEVPIYLKTGNIKTLSNVEKAIVFLGYHELKYETDVPFKVVLNEYINLSKTYGQQRSKDLVNGILESMSKKLERK
ncbi:MAG: transcription antitermination protein NusB [Bdellovibrionales bacterium]|nr:transcription antitermination protein NusB [Bdellovibrionales bacterium]